MVRRKRMAPGEIFGRLTTIRRSGDGRPGKPRWVCFCECGATVTVGASNLRTGNTASCGCLQTEILKAPRIHGEASRSGKSPEYRTYLGMIGRCENPSHKSYKRYGGRGIKVCERWMAGFSFFLEDMGRKPSPSHSIDRLDPNGNYEPSNCRWATEVEQQNNRTDNRVIVHEGAALTLSQLAEQSVVAAPTLAKRLDRGWSVKDAISFPASPISPQRKASAPIEKWRGF